MYKLVTVHNVALFSSLSLYYYYYYYCHGKLISFIFTEIVTSKRQCLICGSVWLSFELWSISTASHGKQQEKYW